MDLEDIREELSDQFAQSMDEAASLGHISSGERINACETFRERIENIEDPQDMVNIAAAIFGSLESISKVGINPNESIYIESIQQYVDEELLTNDIH